MDIIPSEGPPRGVLFIAHIEMSKDDLLKVFCVKIGFLESFYGLMSSYKTSNDRRVSKGPLWLEYILKACYE